MLLAKGPSKDMNSVADPARTKPTVATVLLDAWVPAMTLHRRCVVDTHNVVAAAVRPTRIEFELLGPPKALPTTNIDPVCDTVVCALGSVGKFDIPTLNITVWIRATVTVYIGPWTEETSYE